MEKKAVARGEILSNSLSPSNLDSWEMVCLQRQSTTVATVKQKRLIDVLRSKEQHLINVKPTSSFLCESAVGFYLRQETLLKATISRQSLTSWL